MWRCAQAGQLFTMPAGRKLGTAHSMTTKAVARIVATFQREK